MHLIMCGLFGADFKFYHLYILVLFCGVNLKRKGILLE